MEYYYKLLIGQKRIQVVTRFDEEIHSVDEVPIIKLLNQTYSPRLNRKWWNERPEKTGPASIFYSLQPQAPGQFSDLK